MTRRQPIGPDCRDGKHEGCAGQALDEQADEVVDCACCETGHEPRETGHTDHMAVNVTMTTEAGVQVPIGVEIRWPEDHGVYALRFLKDLPDYVDTFATALLNQLAASGDASLLAAAARMDDEATEAEEAQP